MVVYKPIKAEITRMIIPFLPNPVLRVTVSNGTGKAHHITFGGLDDALYLIASIFQPESPPVTKESVTKKAGKRSRRVAVTKRKIGFLNDWIMDCLKRRGGLTLQDIQKYAETEKGEVVTGRGLASMMRSLEKAGFVTKTVTNDKKIWKAVR